MFEFSSASLHFFAMMSVCVFAFRLVGRSVHSSFIFSAFFFFFLLSLFFFLSYFLCRNFFFFFFLSPLLVLNLYIPFCFGIQFSFFYFVSFGSRQFYVSFLSVLIQLFIYIPGKVYKHPPWKLKLISFFFLLAQFLLEIHNSVLVT